MPDVKPSTPAPRGACADDEGIDLLWVATPEAIAHAGGMDAVLQACVMAVEDVNTTFFNTGLPFHVRIVGMHITDYVEGDGAYLYHLQHSTDGHMDEVHVIRDAKAADVVALVTLQGFCGVAFVVPDNAAWAFQADSIDCLQLYNPFRHELGHNMGSKHWSADGGGYFPWSAGHVLTLDDGTNVGTAMGGNHIAHYSNPNVLYDGVPTGIPAGESGEADNFAAFTVTVPMMADFRCSANACLGDVDFDGVVGVSDMLGVLDGWGPCAGCPADVAFSGEIDVDDVLLVVSTWGDCP
jgi:hypothetical protein